MSNPLAEATSDRAAPPAVFVVFGASGDLTSRKLIPAIEALGMRRLLPGGFSVVGVARTPMSDENFLERTRGVVEKSGGGDQAKHVWEALAGGFRYVAGAYGDPHTYARLRAVLEELDRDRGTAGNRLYYLSTPPATFPVIVTRLAASGLNRPTSTQAFVRIVIEKPYGHDGSSATDLDATVHDAFDERQVYRIDHYLGKETVQNVLALRFANAIFEPIWNRRYVDHVQITVAESGGVGHRGGFYEDAGALRDIVQNHVMQVAALTAMEPPSAFDPQGIRDEKVKALRAVDIVSPEHVEREAVRAQYERGWSGGVSVAGYREEPGVSPHSQTETYVAMRMRFDNWRWAGVPFYIRTGKRLPKRATEVAMQFHTVPHLPFAASQELAPDALVLRIQPNEGVTLRFGAKVPGQSFRVRSVSMDFFYDAAFLEEAPEAYERLILDALVGDPTLFIRSDEVDQAWKICDPILSEWTDGQAPPARYEGGTWGPKEADDLLGVEGRHWRKL